MFLLFSYSKLKNNVSIFIRNLFVKYMALTCRWMDGRKGESIRQAKLNMPSQCFFFNLDTCLILVFAACPEVIPD